MMNYFECRLIMKQEGLTVRCQNIVIYITSDHAMAQTITPSSYRTLNVLGDNLINIAIKNQHKKVRNCQMCGKFKKCCITVKGCSFMIFSPKLLSSPRLPVSHIPDAKKLIMVQETKEQRDHT